MSIIYTWKSDDEVGSSELADIYGNFYAEVFKDPPWCFLWHTKCPEDPESGQAFIRMLVRNGANFLEARCANSDGILVGLGIIIPKLSLDTLENDYKDLAKYADAKPGDCYLAGNAVDSKHRGRKIGYNLMAKRIELAESGQRILLRTQESATSMMELARSFGMKIYSKYEFTQAGSTLERVVLHKTK